VLSYSKLDSGAAKTGSHSHREEAVRAFINIQLVRVGLVISVDREHGIGIDHVVPAMATPP
jgi:hypothetical protein